MPLLNAASTADMSFILLILFLVTSSMDVDKGLERRLPPLDECQQDAIADVSSENVLTLELTANDSLLADGELVGMGELRRRVVAFVGGGKADREKHVISLRVNRNASYDAYFNMQNEIVAAYNVLRNSRAMKVYGCPLSGCTPSQREALREYYPQRVAEAYSMAEEGGVQ